VADYVVAWGEEGVEDEEVGGDGAGGDEDVLFGERGGGSGGVEAGDVVA